MSTSIRGEASIARCRLILAVVALAAVFIDPTEPLLARWLPLSSGHFNIDPYLMMVMGIYLAYSIAVLSAVSKPTTSLPRLARRTMWADVGFGALIGLMTEGVTSPFYPFFSFAVVVTGFRSGLWQAMRITAVSVFLYLCLIVVSDPGSMNLYIMRPAYLAITGYLVGYLGQQRLELQDELRQHEAAEERHRIARELHDGFVQALAGINLRVEGCRRSLQSGDVETALEDLGDLRQSVAREYDELRSYMRVLAGVEIRPVKDRAGRPTELSFDARLNAPLDVVEHVLQISREAINNIRAHAGASKAEIAIVSARGQIGIEIADDGVGLPARVVPWSIASRVNELGGMVTVDDSSAGAKLSIQLPRA